MLTKPRRAWAPSEGRARVNRSHPLASGLQGLAISRTVYLPAFKFLVSTETVATTVTAGARYGLQGIGLRQSTCGDLGPLPAQDDDTSFTMAVYHADTISTPTSTFGLIGNRGLAGGTDADHIKVVLSTPQVADLVFGYSVGGARRGAGDAASFPAQPVRSLLVAVKRGLTCEIWQDGVLKQSTTYTTGQLTATAKNCYYGSDEATVVSYPGYGAFWPTRALSGSEITQLSADPFCFLA